MYNSKTWQKVTAVPCMPGSEVLLAFMRAEAGANAATPISLPAEPYTVRLKRGGVDNALKTSDWEERAAKAASAAAALKANVHAKATQ